MKTLRMPVLVGIVLIASTSVSEAGKVTVKGVHLCCGQCVKIVGTAMKKVDGIDDVACDRDEGTVSYTATDADAAKAGVDALAKAGFHGEAKHDDEDVAFPESGAKEGEKADKISLTGVHACCGQCVDAHKEALKDVAGVESVEVDRKERTVTLSGKDIEVVAAVKALNKGGFHGKVKK